MGYGVMGMRFSIDINALWAKLILWKISECIIWVKLSLNKVKIFIHLCVIRKILRIFALLTEYEPNF